jgi:hypothetical protein
VHAIPSTGPYRATDRIVKVIRGDADAVRRALAGSIARGAAALAVAVTVAIAMTALAGSHRADPHSDAAPTARAGG